MGVVSGDGQDFERERLSPPTSHTTTIIALQSPTQQKQQGQRLGPETVQVRSKPTLTVAPEQSACTLFSRSGDGGSLFVLGGRVCSSELGWILQIGVMHFSRWVGTWTSAADD